MSFDVLQDKIRAMKNPTVVGLDPKPEYVPPQMRKECYDQYGETLEGAAEAIYRFNCGLMDALWRTIRYAREKGFFVIADIKRGDIGSTAQAYSDGWLGKTKVGSAERTAFDADCVTINGYMGSDAIQPFIETCKAEDKCLFVLVKTSNPSSGELQDMVAGDRVVYKVMGDLTERLGRGTAGRHGFHLTGAVVGATYPSDLRELRRRLEHTFFLVPGYGAQGGTAEDVQYAFNKYGHGAIVNSSRGIMCAWQKTGRVGSDYQQAARDAAVAMRDDIKQFVTIV
mgnify:CR=1 FL=1